MSWSIPFRKMTDHSSPYKDVSDMMVVVSSGRSVGFPDASQLLAAKVQVVPFCNGKMMGGGSSGFVTDLHENIPRQMTDSRRGKMIDRIKGISLGAAHLTSYNELCGM
jgi:hypothetical protein